MRGYLKILLACTEKTPGRVRIKRQNYPVTVDSSICWFSTDRKSVSRLTRYV